jgi:hypothetical protein
VNEMPIHTLSPDEQRYYKKKKNKKKTAIIEHHIHSMYTDLLKGDTNTVSFVSYSK